MLNFKLMLTYSFIPVVFLLDTVVKWMLEIKNLLEEIKKKICPVTEEGTGSEANVIGQYM